MAVAAHPGAHPYARILVQSVPVSCRQVAGSKSLLPFLGTDAMPGIAFPRSCECYRGSLGPRFPTRPGRRCPLPRGTVRCYDCLRPSRSVRFWLPSGTLGWRAVLCVPPGSCRAWLVGWPRRPPNARVLVAPVTLAPAIAPKETGGSPEFPDYPLAHMPRSQTPVVSRSLAVTRTGLLPSGTCTPSALGPVARTYPIVHHYTFFGVQWRGLCSRLTSASDTASQRSPFGSAADLVASLWSGGTWRLLPSHPLGNVDMFQEVSPLFSCPGFSSARARSC